MYVRTERRRHRTTKAANIQVLLIPESEDVKCLFFVTGASAEQTRTFLWYEELFLIWMR